jgi:MraZ protein
MAMPDSDPNKNKLRKLYMGYSEDLTIDKDGRVVLALRLREKLGVVEGELSFMGLGEYFQIWKLESFEADVDEPLDEWLDEMGEDFDPMSLVP